MSEYVHLIGSELVERAGNNMMDAADGMREAASEITESLRFHRTFLDEWLTRFEQAIARIDGAEGGR